MDLEGRVHVAYHVGDPDIPSPPVTSWYVRSVDGGVSWSTPLRLDQSTGHAAFPRFDVSGTGGDRLAIAWRDQRRKPDWDVYVAVSDDGGASFTERAGEAGGEFEWDPTAAVDPDGRIHLAYMTYRQPEDGGVTIDYKRADSLTAAFGSETTLSQGFSRLPFWAPDHARDRLWLFWKDERDTSPSRSWSRIPSPARCGLMPRRRGLPLPRFRTPQRSAVRSRSGHEESLRLAVIGQRPTRARPRPIPARQLRGRCARTLAA